MLRKLLLVLGLLAVSGSAFQVGALVKKDCIPCSAWCKKHPNAERCN